jgi:hypothetical protein
MENLREADHLGDLNVDRKMLLDRLKQIWDGFYWV